MKRQMKNSVSLIFKYLISYVLKYIDLNFLGMSQAHTLKLIQTVGGLSKTAGCSFLAHSSDIDDLLEGLDGVLEDWFDGLHDTESSLHIVDLWLHAFNGLHLSGDLNEWLSIIESLEDSGGEGFLDVLDGGGLGNSGVTVTSGLG